jgi:peptidoglycan/xylan/chitin deacetylase (PgdA/CDA1 family)
MLLSRVRPIVLAIRRARNLLLRTIDTPVVVLLYHRVAALASDPQQLAVSPDNFREQMVYLKKRYPLVRFEEDWSRVKSLTIAVTFDDGYADNFLNALPILEEVGIPATFFVSTGNLDTEYEYWWDELERIILGDLHLPENFSLDDNGLARRWLTDNFAAREEFYAEFQPLMKNLVVERREEWLELLRQWSGAGVAGRRDYRAMTREELQHLARSKWVTVGAHSVTHSRLSALSEHQQSKEIYSSKSQLESMLGKTITTFSYPYGRKDDYNQISVRLCREAGFLKAASNFAGFAYHWTDALQIPRYLVRNWDVETFAARLKEIGV